MPDLEHASAAHHPYRAKLALAALGVVYGDIGTSPLYALRECFSGTHGVARLTARYGFMEQPNAPKLLIDAGIVTRLGSVMITPFVVNATIAIVAG